ncbi:hypothetical protein JCM8547_005858 [Rhodosporidiobolus lusitaniae]
MPSVIFETAAPVIEAATAKLPLKGAAPSVVPNNTIDLSGPFPDGDWRNDLARDGYAIIRGAVPEERALSYRDRAYEWIAKFPLGFDRDDKSTWTQEHLPMTKKGGMFHHSIGHEAFLWELRQEKGLIAPFAQLWGTDELLVSFDGANVSLPGKMQDPNQPAWWHQDQDADKRGFHCAQGLVNLAPNGPKDGGLMLLKGSAKLNDKYFTEVWNGTDGVVLKGDEAQTDFFGYTPEILSWFYENGAKWVKTELNPGDLVIWDSRTVHYNVPPLGDRDRVAAYTCFMPARLCAPDQLEQKQKLFAGRQMTTHWPVSNLFQKSDVVLRDGKQCPHLRHAPFEEPVLTDKLLKLAGVKPY